MNDQDNQELGQPPRLPSDYIAILADGIVRLRELLTEAGPPIPDNVTVDELRLRRLGLDMFGAILRALDNVDSDVAVLLRGKDLDATAQAWDNILYEIANLEMDLVETLNQAEIIAFGAVQEDSLEFMSTFVFKTPDDIISLGNVLMYRCFRIEAHVNGTTVDEEMADLIGVDPKGFTKLQGLIAIHGENEGIAKFWADKFAGIADERKGDAPKHAASVFFLSGRSRG